MQRIETQTVATFLMVLVFYTGGCNHTTNFATTAPSSAISPAAPKLTSDQYNQEIAKLKQIIKKKSKSPAAKAAHLKLAHLYSDHQNNNRNYRKALEHLQACIRLDDAKVDGDTLNWLASLKEIERLSQEVDSQNRRIGQMKQKLEQSKKEASALTRTNRKLRREEISLRDKTRKLEESNSKLQKTIEMLKDLDQRLEEKRRNFR
jgi:DNA repair exonuclease SbcCD ATPase subunit